MSLRAVAKKKITFQDPTSKSGFGPTPYLTKQEENSIEEWLIEMARKGFPRKSDDVLDTVQKFLTENPRETTFVNNRPGQEWLKAFLKRHPTLTQRTSEGVTKASASLAECDIKKWFQEIRNYRTNENLLLIVLSKEQLLNKRVCEKHFDVFQFGNEGRRLRYSYPSLLTDNEIAHGVPLTATGWDVTTEHNYCKEQNEDDFTEAVLVVRKPGSDVTIEHNYYKEQNDCSKSSVEIGSSGIDSNTNVVKQMMPKGSTCTKKQTETEI
ncbi:unnamed protein product [Parnassius apollo]|uniref:(apollo) hypothetical protein n=1 Tax=Parnassius apollo TaxID=110799 RepID=A0A8S3W3S1_PARAO|nr:unnamed protein product [Parnassius apollo]